MGARGMPDQGGTGNPPDDWNDDRGSWLIYILPYMEQDNIYKNIAQLVGGDPMQVYNSLGKARDPNFNVPSPYHGMFAAQRTKAPKSYRCPSDPDNTGFKSNYAGSIGSQCAIGPCGYDPNQGWCHPEDGNKGNPALFGYSWSPDHGNAWGAADIRGCFNRLGAEIRFASVTDGLSNTILVGEIKCAEHDHVNPDPNWSSWTHFNGGVAHVSTIVPINSPSRNNAWCVQDAVKGAHNGNWNISWGFKSYHTNGANFLFGDGSVKFLPQTIDHRLYQLLGCRNDGVPAGVP
jgi:prepilin-type processing-associated H-X9-DG protein